MMPRNEIPLPKLGSNAVSDNPSAAPWIEQALQQLDAIAQLEAGWDSNGAQAPDPALVRGSVRLGSIAPGAEAVSRLYVRVRAVPGASLPVKFLLREGSLFNERTGAGEEVLSVISSQLTAEPAFSVDSVEPGASIPIVASRSRTPAGNGSRDGPQSAVPLGVLFNARIDCVELAVDSDAARGLGLHHVPRARASPAAESLPAFLARSRVAVPGVEGQ
jgi:hypothetical protein